LWLLAVVVAVEFLVAARAAAVWAIGMITLLCPEIHTPLALVVVELVVRLELVGLLVAEELVEQVVLLELVE
jgi:hypothetical protein